MSPSTGASGEVAPAWVPLHIRHAIVVGRTKVLNARAPLALLTLLELIVVEVEIPELEFGLARRSYSSKDNMTTLRRPTNGVACAARERTCQVRVNMSTTLITEEWITDEGL